MPDALAPHWFQILLALADGPRHGLDVMKEVYDRTEGAMRLWPGMLYGALRRMAADGLVVETAPPADAVAGGGRPRYYRITPAGRRACAEEARRLARFVDAARAKKLLKGARP